MARLKNRFTGSTVSVADEKAERFGPEWERLDEAKPAPKKPAPKPAK